MIYSLFFAFYRREIWVDEILWDRDTESEFVLVDKLRQKENPEKFRQYMRMLPHQFDYILNLISPRIQKQDTTFLKSITPSQKLIVTIRYVVRLLKA